MIKSTIQSAFRHLGYEIIKKRDQPEEKLPADFGPDEIEIIRAVRPYTMTTPESLYALCHAVRYVVRNRIPGSLVECGVWRGGSTMAMALTLLTQGVTDRDLYLFDTFEGMPRPGDNDRDYTGKPALSEFERLQTGTDRSDWDRASLDDVQQNVARTRYENQRFHLVQGRVEETIPARAPETIALLRLDTDWYESTRHELVHLYPRLSPGGILIIDDYGYWQGSRKATDEYLATQATDLYLNRVDFTVRLAVKPMK